MGIAFDARVHSARGHIGRRFRRRTLGCALASGLRTSLRVARRTGTLAGAFALDGVHERTRHALGLAAVARLGHAGGFPLALKAFGHGLDQRTRIHNGLDLALARQQRVGEHDDQQHQQHHGFAAKRQGMHVIHGSHRRQRADHDGEG